MKKTLLGIAALFLFFGITSGSAFTQTPVTVIDLTDFTNGSDVTQPCIWIKTFDNANHYETCTVHKDKRNITAHNKKITGLDVCYDDVTARVETCGAGCGYTKSLPKKKHALFGMVAAPVPFGIAHGRQCSVCLQSGRVESMWHERCKDSRGTPLNCSTTADQACAVCGTVWLRSQHGEAQNSAKCNRCGVAIMQVVSTNLKYLSDTKVQITSNFTFMPGTTNISFSYSMHLYTGAPIPYTITGTGLSRQVVQTLTMSADVASTYVPVVCIEAVYLGRPVMARTILFNTVHPDHTAPKITAIGIQPPGDVWATNKSIAVTATDAFAPQNNNTVSIGLFDESGKTIVPYGQATAPLNSTVYQKTFMPDIEINTNKRLLVKAKDRWGNESVSPVTVSKIDRVAPKLLTLGPYVNPWAKSRAVVFESSDAGVGKAEMAFSQTKDFAQMNPSGAKFLRSYVFVGDVYKEQTRKIYLRDGLGNAAVSYMKFNRLDNTAPKITSHAAQINDRKTELRAQLNTHDRHPVLGIGSGVAKYAVLNKNTVPKPTDFSTVNNFTFTENGTYYAYCMDAVGNISPVYPLRVTDIIVIPDGGDTSGFAAHYDYRTNTDVFTTIEVSNNTATSRFTEDRVTATLTLTGSGGFQKTLSKQVIVPKGRKSMVWFAWRTPSMPQNVTAKAVITHEFTITNPNISISITNLFPETPPDPKATDTNTGWHTPTLPTFRHKANTIWGEWKYTKPNWTWQPYTSAIRATAQAVPDMEVPTGTESAGKWKMKSGYGFNMHAQAAITGAAERTAAQSAVYLFPEFQYQTYARVGRSAGVNMFTLPNNPFSQYGQPAHFTPLWFPDEPYKPYCVIFDCWTPGGQLSADATGVLEIQGNLFQDWHIGPAKG